MNRKDELQQIITDAQDELSVLQDAEYKEQNSKFVGKFFRYQNGYNANDTWWLYVFVRGLNAGGHFITTKFETDNDGKTTIEAETIHYHSFDSYKEITELEFMKAWEETTQKINGIKF